MSEDAAYSPGGFVRGPRFAATIEADECILDRDGVCQRRGEAHDEAAHGGGSDYVEVRALNGGIVRYVRGQCWHVRTVPVTISTGETVARICLACDAQIPAAGWRP